MADGTGPQPAVEMRLSLVDAEVDGGRLLPALNGLRPAQSAPWASYVGLTLPFRAGPQLNVALRGEGARYEDDLNTRKLKAYQALDLRVSWPVRRDTEVFASETNFSVPSSSSCSASVGVFFLPVAEDPPSDFWMVSRTPI